MKARSLINSKKFKITFYSILFVFGFIFLAPNIYLSILLHNQIKPVVTISNEFPVTVFPESKLIVENDEVNKYLASPSSPLQASVFNVFDIFKKVFTLVVTTINETPWYQGLAFAGGNRLVNLSPGLRKEQVANSFTNSLSWDSKNKKKFLTNSTSSTPILNEGMYAPGEYVVTAGMTPEEVQNLINKKFTEDVLSHYGTTTAKTVPLSTALTVASLIERETINGENARLVSGIIWNRVFLNMNLQLDATLQYVKAKDTPQAVWWPKVLPKDKNIKSPYNTYQHPGLPPGPIANPSVASIVAALNPIKTTCLFYFNDDRGGFHCTNTYEEHVLELKKIYGRGR
ncbi:hypothetical protein BH11PAT3_BH11PAT3_3530 [soil metagenome]